MVQKRDLDPGLLVLNREAWSQHGLRSAFPQAGKPVSPRDFPLLCWRSQGPGWFLCQLDTGWSHLVSGTFS